jgi:hypothetical protein
MFEEIIITLISTASIVVGFRLLQKGSYLLKNGRKAKAIIFKNNQKSSRTRIMYYPVVRFLTDKQEWISQELNTGSNPAKREGTSVEVIYDPDKPSTVEINTGFRLKVLPIVLLAIGLTGLLILVLELFDITQLID